MKNIMMSRGQVKSGRARALRSFKLLEVMNKKIIFLMIVLFLGVWVISGVVAEDVEEIEDFGDEVYSGDFGFLYGFEDGRLIVENVEPPKGGALVIREGGGSIKYKPKGSDEFIKYDNLKQGSEFIFKDGELEGAEFIVTKDSSFKVSEKDIMIPGGSEIVIDKEKTKAVVNGNFFKIEDNEYKVDPNKENKFILDNNGELIEADFYTSKVRIYRIGNHKFYVSRGSRVIYKDKKIDVIQDSNKAYFNKPKKIDVEKETDISLNYKYLNGIDMVIESKDQKGLYQEHVVKSSKEFTIGFDKQGAYAITEEFNIDGVLVKDKDKQKIYLNGQGEYNYDYKGAYLSLNSNEKKAVVGINVVGESPSFLFKKDGKYFPDMPGESDYVSVKTFGIDTEGKESAFAYMENRAGSKKSGKLVTLNGVQINNDEVSPHIDPEKEKLLLRRSNIITEFKGSKGHVPFRAMSFVGTKGKVENVLGEGNYWVYGNDGLIGVGKDPDFIPVKAAPYTHHPGLYRGASEWLVYYETPSEKTFERFTNVNLVDYTNAGPDTLRMLMDVYGSAPPKARGSLNKLILENSAGYAGLAEWGGVVHLAGGGIGVGTFSHELAHVWDFAVSRNFNKAWRRAGGYRGPQTYWYGYYNNYEAISTFREKIYQNYWSSSNDGRYFGSWKAGLTTNPNAKNIRARVALMYKYGGISRAEADRVFELANLGTSDEDYERYISMS